MQAQNDTLYVLDSYALIYRSYYAFINRPLINEKGENVSAVFGFFRNFLRILKDYNPQFACAAFDSRTPTFRHKMFSEYKATRQKTPDDLHAQIPVIEEILTALGIPILRCDGFEADDIIATLATECARTGRPCRILTGDKDLMQLVNDTTHILKPDKSGGWQSIDEAGVVAEWGVKPCQMLDILSLTGDAADNIPGVKGIGEKTAQKLLTQYGTLGEIYNHVTEIGGAIGKKLVDGKESAFFSQKLVALCTDVDVKAKIEDLAIRSLDFAACSRLLLRAGAKAVAKSFAEAGGVVLNGGANGTGNGTGAVAGGVSAADNTGATFGGAVNGVGTDGAPSAGSALSTGSMPSIASAATSTPNTAASTTDSFAPDSEPAPAVLTQNSGDYRAITELSELRALIGELLQNGICAFDCETDSLNAHKARLVGFSLSYKKGEAFYVPLVSAESGMLGATAYITKADALSELERIFGTSTMRVVTHNGKYDYEVLRAAGLQKPKCTFIDTMIASWVLDSERASFSLEYLAQTRLGLKTIPFEEVVPKTALAKGMTFADVPLTQAVSYAAEDADLTLQLWHVFESELKAAATDTLFYQTEMPLLPILAEMEIAGIYLDTQKLRDYGTELSAQIEQAQKDVFSLVGHDFNIASTKQLQQVLFTERKLPTGKKTKTGFSTDTAVLEELALLDPVPQKILEYRTLTKLLSTYVDALPLLADENGRVHTSFIQTGTATGRLSSRDPNLQNIPVRDEAGRKIRSSFCAQNGRVLVSADYAQIELVILAHLSRDKALCRAFNDGVDVHKATARLIFGVGEGDVTSDMRRTAKTINFGVMYGMSAFRLSNELGIPRTKAKEFIDAYFATYSGVQNFIFATIEQAEKCGYVETIFGRKRFIRNINSRNKTEKAAAERIAVNTPIQGTAADIVKCAMIGVEESLRDFDARLLLQVHDELIVECSERDCPAVCDVLRKKMEGVVQLSVPLKVSVESGVNWGLFH